MKMIATTARPKVLSHIEGYNGGWTQSRQGWLSVKLRHMGTAINHADALAHRYHDLLAEATIPSASRGSFLGDGKVLSPVRSTAFKNREAFQAQLAEAGSAPAIHYPSHCINRRPLTSRPTRRRFR